MHMHALFSVLLLSLSAVAIPVFAEDQPEREPVVIAGNISYVSGGIGEDSRLRMASLSQGAGFNLKVVFALQDGEYLSGVDIRIVDRSGKQVLQATTEGPILLVRLPAGSYDFFASVGGREQKQRLTVAAGKLGSTVFRWPSE